MKLIKGLTSLAFIAVLALYASCGGGGGETPIQDQQLGKLAKTWKISNATRDGQAVDYTGFQLTISGTPGATSFGYSTSGRPALSPWKSSGQWAFGQSVETQIVRDPGTADELQMTYVVTDNSLQLTFTFNGTGFSRTSVVTGQWVFNFVP